MVHLGELRREGDRARGRAPEGRALKNQGGGTQADWNHTERKKTVKRNRTQMLWKEKTQPIKRVIGRTKPRRFCVAGSKGGTKKRPDRGRTRGEGSVETKSIEESRVKNEALLQRGKIIRGGTQPEKS